MAGLVFPVSVLYRCPFKTVIYVQSRPSSSKTFNSDPARLTSGTLLRRFVPGINGPPRNECVRLPVLPAEVPPPTDIQS